MAAMRAKSTPWRWAHARMWRSEMVLESTRTPSRSKITASHDHDTALLRLEAVADALDRRDAAILGAELGAQPPDVNVHRARLDLVGARVAPHAIEQVLAAEHAPGGGQQGVQQVELLGRQLDRPAPHGDRMARGIEAHGAHAAAHLEAVHAGKHEVEHDQIGRRRAQAGQRLAAAGRGAAAKALALEVMDDEAADVRLVL